MPPPQDHVTAQTAEAVDKLKAAIKLIEAFGSAATETAANLAEQAYQLLTQQRAQ